MKCDELKEKIQITNDPRMVYLKSDVDAAIDELKAAHHKERHEYIKMIAELEQKLEDAKATAYAESVDAGMENRRLKRALWLARAEKARFLAMIIDQHPYTQVLHFTSRKRDDSGKPLGIARTAMEWWRMFKEVERKCLKKAEEYR